MAGKQKTRVFLTRELGERLVECVKTKRLFDSQVAIMNDVHPDTLKNWVKRGLLPDAEDPYKTFAEEYAKAQIDDEVTALGEIMGGTKPVGKGDRPGDWKAAAWYLERKYPTRWNPTRQPVAGPAEAIDVERMVREAADQNTDLVELLKDPPPELIAALREASAEIRALLEANVQGTQQVTAGR